MVGVDYGSSRRWMQAARVSGSGSDRGLSWSVCVGDNGSGREISPVTCYQPPSRPEGTRRPRKAKVFGIITGTCVVE
ncbi:hypothetical protein ACOMHN_065379 [Nucella lapillus]